MRNQTSESSPEQDEDISETIISRERAALDRWGQGDPSGFLDICTPDVVYFDPYLDRRIDGLDALTRYYEGLRGRVRVTRYELLDPLVQRIGNAAILTFNFVSYGEKRGCVPLELHRGLSQGRR